MSRHMSWTLAFVGLAFFGGAVGRGEEAATADLPITRVVLFNSGVGYFEHFGKIEGTKHVDLKFQTDEINDLLKSMVLQDLGGGQVSTVTYDSRDPLARTLKTFTIDLTRNPTLADLLEQVRGERVEIQASQPIEAVILGVETRTVESKNGSIEARFLDLKTDRGLRSVKMDEIVECHLLNKQLDAELDEALALLAGARASDKKTVALEFRGQGQRDVRVGYIQEAPVWKVSYRLVLADDKPPFLQGWAIVENTGDHDWKDVRLALVSGRPISFVMDLYQPLYVERPIVVPEEFAGLRPRLHDQDLADREALMKHRAAEYEAGRRGHVAGGAAFGGGGGGGGFFGGGMGGSGGSGGGGGAAAPEPSTPAALDPSQGVPTAADAGDVGELFRYDIKTPVTLARRKSAMLPIVNAAVQGSKVSIYNQGVQAKHPYNGFRLTNSTNLFMSQGPITVFDAGDFAGDARIEDVPPGSKRLISYAIDLDVEVAPEVEDRPDELLSVRIVKGTMKLEHRKRDREKYTIKNAGERPKTVLVERPIDVGWELVSPKEPPEKTRDLYRFEVAVDPGQTKELVVEEQQTSKSEVLLSSLDMKTVLTYVASTKAVSPAVEKALQSIVEMRKSLDAAEEDCKRVEAKLAAIDQEQGRIRSNMSQLDRTSSLYNRYVKTLNDQEDQIEQLRKQLAGLRDKEAAQHEALEQHVQGLNVE
jgi:hypothetical protein